VINLIIHSPVVTNKPVFCFYKHMACNMLISLDNNLPGEGRRFKRHVCARDHHRQTKSVEEGS
ncbi:MAG: hypothetical protein U9Q38_10115, partial [Thermodesulfobacteriota bacterium]|nr:hypothetical protein [Thermodesulfobacteriota bacterium]